MTSHYDHPLHLPLVFSQIDFGAGANITRVIAVPKPFSGGVGMRGKVMWALVHNITEDLVGSSTDGAIRVGDGSDDDKYFDTGLVLDETVDVGESLQLFDDGSKVDIEGGRTNVTVTFVVTTGAPTGIADVTLMTAWW